MNDLLRFLRARLAEDEQWALAASKPYRYAIGNPEVPPGGVHWTWVVGDNWEPVTPNPVEDEVVTFHDHGVSRWDCNLATVEEWQADYRMMPTTYAGSIEEMDASAAGHIVRHDPARVLRRVAAKREFLDHAVRTRGLVDQQPTREQAESLRLRWASYLTAIKFDAVEYDDHPEYREEWRP